MGEDIEKILDELQGAVQAVEELNDTVPGIQEYYKKCQELIGQLDKRKEEITELVSTSKALKEEIKKQSSLITKKIDTKIEAVTRQMDDAIKKIELIQNDIEGKIKDIPSIDPLKSKVSSLEKEIKRINEKIDSLERNVTEEALDELREELFTEISQKYSDLKTEFLSQIIANSSEGASNKSKSVASKVTIPTGYLSCSLNSTKDIRRKKPYGVLFEETGSWVLASHWTELSEKMTLYIIENYALDGGTILRESEKDDGWGHYYFMDGNQNGYTYIPEYRIGVYKAGAVESLEIYKYMCEVYGINKNKVKVYYK